jgi:5-methylthioribose kinase
VAQAAGVTVEPAGDGNINWVRRARAAGGRSWIVKQARPALERFPQYQASTERIVFEHRYFALASKLPEAEICPRIVDFDECERVLVMEDLGSAERLDRALARGAEVTPAAAALGRFLGAMHAATTDPALAARFENHEMRGLHGDHIFALPLAENDFPLSPALRAEADRLRRDPGLRRIAEELHRRYREPRGALLHGDVQAGNVLLTGPGGSRPKLLDAEIAHVGDPAFDLGILVAHLCLPAVGRGRGEEAALGAARAAWSAYRDRLQGVRLRGALEVSSRDVVRYAGIEMLRRTIGAARVPAAEPPEAGLRILARACAWLREPQEL